MRRLISLILFLCVASATFGAINLEPLSPIDAPAFEQFKLRFNKDYAWPTEKNFQQIEQHINRLYNGYGELNISVLTAETIAATTLEADTVNEHTAAAGVTIDGVELKDSSATVTNIKVNGTLGVGMTPNASYHIGVDGGGAGDHIVLLNGTTKLVNMTEDVSGNGRLEVRNSGGTITAVIEGSNGSIAAGDSTNLIKWKIFGGTLGTDGDDSIAHGLTATNIISVTGNAYNSHDSNYNCQGYAEAASANDALRFIFDGSNVRILYGSRHNSQTYKFIIIYS